MLSVHLERMFLGSLHPQKVPNGLAIRNARFFFASALPHSASSNACGLQATHPPKIGHPHVTLMRLHESPAHQALELMVRIGHDLVVADLKGSAGAHGCASRVLFFAV